jgi:2-dehydro-3-deoxyphosphogluconate aldolase/(4S)-4-hydroxy-2-oxoglutarate aldolase
MNNKTEAVETLKKQGLLPLFFHRDKVVAANILRALYRSGVRVIEFTNRGAEALDNFSYLRQIRDKELHGLLLAAGTIKTKQHAQDFINEGADFIISPGFDKGVNEVAVKTDTFWVPGCMTPTEIMNAEESGATLIKLFPGNILGPVFLSAIKELFPGLQFIPTGGVLLEKENLTSWFKSGVMAVGAGSTLVNKAETDAGDFTSLENSARKALQLISWVKINLPA